MLLILQTLSPHSVIIKYADDNTTLFVGQHSSVDIYQEYDNISPSEKKLIINSGKTKDIVFNRPASSHLNIPPPLPDIEQITQDTIPGIDITPLSSSHVFFLLSPQYLTYHVVISLYIYVLCIISGTSDLL